MEFLDRFFVYDFLIKFVVYLFKFCSLIFVFYYLLYMLFKINYIKINLKFFLIEGNKCYNFIEFIVLSNLIILLSIYN